MPIRNFASEEMFRFEAEVIDATTGMVREKFSRGPYPKIGTARGVASQKVNYPYVSENERAARQGKPEPWIINVKIQRAKVIWEGV